MRSICAQCQNPFRYKPVNNRPRALCDRCRKENEREHSRRSGQKIKKGSTEERFDVLLKAGVAKMDRVEVGKIMGCHKERIRQLERTALLKIRAHPEARRLFEIWKAEGAPTVQSKDKELGAELLKWHMALAELWETYHKLFDLGLIEATKECLDEIKRFYEVLDKAMPQAQARPLTYA